MTMFWNKGKNGEKEMSFLEHLEELRWHIIRAILAIVFFMIIAFIFKSFIFDKIILAPKALIFFYKPVAVPAWRILEYCSIMY
jgi:Sec-independent protein secretion pathway component TatC